MKNYKKDFPFFDKNKSLIYLDNAATTQKPKMIIKSISDFYERNNSNIRRGSYRLAEKTTDLYEDARETIAKFLGAETSEISFTSGTTEGLNLIARAVEKQIKKGDEIICLGTEHHSNLLPWQALAKNSGATFKLIFPKNTDLTFTTSEIIDNLSPRTKIVAFASTSNFSGFKFKNSEIKEIVEAVKKIGGLSVIDGTQTAQHQKINLSEIDPDFFAFSGHKIYGPTGIGVLYTNKRVRVLIDPPKYGGEMVKSVELEKTVYEDFPWILEAGTPNIEGAITLGTAIKYVTKIGFKNIELTERALTKKLSEELLKIPEIEIYGPKDYRKRAPVISFNVKGLHPHDVGYFLDKKNIAVRTGQHCAGLAHQYLSIPASVRASLAFYNSEEDINKLTKTLKEIIKKLK